MTARISAVTFERGQTFNTIKMSTVDHAIVEFTNGSKMHLYGDEARKTYNAWNEQRTVRVVKRSADGWNVSIVEVTVRWACPVCGGPRGEPHVKNFCEDGEWYNCDVWENPCGHVDMYRNVLKEVAE